ncbi:MAG TPA: ribosome maturation factor RimM [Nitrospira sp.]|nr:ribosome maturation factor RimM [Nitrospira sp.]
MAVAHDDRVTIGKIERPFGVKGEVKVRSLSDVPGRFDSLGPVSVLKTSGQASENVVTRVRRAGADYIVQFAGITTPEEAGMLRGGFIQIPHQGNLPRSPDVFYECDLVGMTVFDEQGTELGDVETTWQLPGHDVLVVKRGTREWLVPAVKEFVKSVDMSGRRMVVRGVEGLIEDRDAL